MAGGLRRRLGLVVRWASGSSPQSRTPDTSVPPHGIEREFATAVSLAPRPVLVLTHGLEEADCLQWAGTDVTIQALHEFLAAEREPFSSIVLAVRDRVHLHRSVSAVPNLGRVRWIGCWMSQPGGRAPSIVPRPEWPRLAKLQVACASSAFAVAEFARPVAVRRVLIDFARHSAGQRLAPGWPVLGALADDPNRWPVADPGAVVADDVATAVLPEDPRIPPDLFLQVDPVSLAVTEAEPNPITGRRPVVVGFEPDIDWASFDALSPAGQAAAAVRAGMVAVGGLDEHVFNPSGFKREWELPVVPLVPDPAHPHFVEVEIGGRRRCIDTRRGVTDEDVHALRSVQGVRADWRGGTGPVGYARLLVALTMAGVPVVTNGIPPWAPLVLGQELSDELMREADLREPLAREEASLRLRRTALRSHSSQGWRARLAAQAGVPAKPAATLSVLLTTRRPEMLDFALRMVSRQGGVQIELILAAHGFAPDRDILARSWRSEVPIEVVLAPSSLPFGEVLNLAAARASGSHLVKMDDDDWYGSHFLEDLLLAQGYSGADVVGAAPEFNFLEPMDLTVRHSYPTEVYRDFVAGGTMLMRRGVYYEMGGFRSVRKYVDAALLAAVRHAGGSIYRTHGLGYVLRRRGEGHTWDAGMDYFTDPARVSAQWDGFRSSEAMRWDGPDPALPPAE